MLGLSNEEGDGLFSDMIFTISGEIVTLFNTLLVGAVGACRHKQNINLFKKERQLSDVWRSNRRKNADHVVTPRLQRFCLGKSSEMVELSEITILFAAKFRICTTRT